VVTVVPSKRGREHHPFELAVQLGRDLRRLYRPLLAARQADQIDRVYGSDDAFATSPSSCCSDVFTRWVARPPS
jgi:hypothetical protein